MRGDGLELCCMSFQARMVCLPGQPTGIAVIRGRYWMKESAEEEKALMQKEFGAGRIRFIAPLAPGYSAQRNISDLGTGAS